MKDGEKLPHGAVFRYEFVCCGKPQCKACGGIAYAHGPYWYAYWHTGGRKDPMRKVYVGKAPAISTPAELRAMVTLRDLKRREQERRRKEQEARQAREAERKEREKKQKERKQRERKEREQQQQRQRRPEAQDAADAALLGVPIDCSPDALRKAWRKKIGAAHPDVAGQGATNQAQAINAAHQRMLNRRGWARA